MLIRPAVVADLPVLPQIEAAAGLVFATVGMQAIADDDDPTVEELLPYAAAGRAWVAVDDGPPVAYLVAEVVDGYGHVEQVSVHPGHAGRGIGRALVDEAGRWAVAGGLRGLTLTTFADVPWNAPYYARCGFRVMADGEIGPGLREIRRVEAARGLDTWPRVCMVRTASPAPA